MHVSVKARGVLLYNPLNGKVLESSKENEVRRLVRTLLSRRSLLVTRLDVNDLRKPGVSKFVRGVRSRFMGDLIGTRHSSGRPMEMMPRVKIQEDFNRLRKTPERSGGEGVLQYLWLLTLYVNSACRQECTGCAGYRRQFVFCTRERGRPVELEIGQLAALLDEVQASGLGTIDIVGGDVLSHGRLEALAALLKHQAAEVRLWVHYLNLAEQMEKLRVFQFENAKIIILVTLPCNDERLQACLEGVDALRMAAQLRFVVQEERDLRRTERIMTRCGERSCQLVPYYDGTNLSFFERNVFIDKTDILEARPTQGDIYVNSVFNRSAFGKLAITSRGLIYANLNTRPLGTLGKDSISKVLTEEMNTGRNWRRIRSRVRPCRDCVYESLCPSLSNYEYLFRKNNLCSVWDGLDKKRSPVTLRH